MSDDNTPKPTALDGAPETPLHAAAWAGDIEEAIALVSAGADVNHIDTAGETPIHGAAAWGHAAMVKYLIAVGARMDILGTPGGLSPLRWAAGWGNLETVRALVESGADRKAKNTFGPTPEEVATKHGRKEIVTYLRGLDEL
jgi:ankyrin repeat protein